MSVIDTTLPHVRISFDRRCPVSERVYLKESIQAYRAFMAIWDHETIDLYEEFKVIYLDQGNGVMGYRDLARGSCTGATVDIKHLLSIALACNACCILLAHNHPSGRTEPSRMDIQLTQKVKGGAELLGLTLLDHLVITKEGYYSFGEEGEL